MRVLYCDIGQSVSATCCSNIDVYIPLSSCCQVRLVNQRCSTSSYTMAGGAMLQANYALLSTHSFINYRAHRHQDICPDSFACAKILLKSRKRQRQRRYGMCSRTCSANTSAKPTAFSYIYVSVGCARACGPQQGPAISKWACQMLLQPQAAPIRQVDASNLTAR